MALYQKLRFKTGDVILKQERGRGLVPVPKSFTKKIKENPSLLWDSNFIIDSIKKGELEDGALYYVWKASSQKYFVIDFSRLQAWIEV
jgi:hypothetical protein